MNAEQYRALVNRLEAIQEAEDDQFVSTQADGPTGTTTQGTDRSPAGIETPSMASTPADTDTDLLKRIEHAPTFKEAYTMAARAGLSTFKWCQCKEYQVKKAAPKPRPGQGAQPKKPDHDFEKRGPYIRPDGPMQGYIAPKKERDTFVQTNPMGDFDPTPFSGQAAAPRRR